MASWAVTPILRRTAGGLGDHVVAATRARPGVGLARVVRIRTAVVLPAPFGPEHAEDGPGRDLRLTPARAWVSP